MEDGDRELGLRMGDGGGVKDEGGVNGEKGRGTGDRETGYSGGLRDCQASHLPAVLPLLIPTPDSKWTRCSLSKAM